MQRYLTAREVGALTGIARTTLYELAQADGIPHTRIGKLVRFPERDLEDWLRRHTRGAGGEGDGRVDGGSDGAVGSGGPGVDGGRAARLGEAAA
jgi:excisionase family DNA binding protein